ncbi:MAG: DUF2334 domain-containing protein [Deltaproteobacteria bacterium]|nr:DUF2334 domain-containing protein [Deltaproteobacteria bacterium]
MRYVVLRDDDVNATTPPEQLETLWRPFLDRGMPVSLCVIPAVDLAARRADGHVEEFVAGPDAGTPASRPIGTAPALVEWLRGTGGACVAAHGLTHAMHDGRYEMDLADRARAGAMLDRCLARFEEAGLGRPRAFVAPQDRLSRASMLEAARRFAVVSGGWYSLAKVPRRWWPGYVASKKLLRRPHWRAGGTVFLSHPGCLFAPWRDPAGMAAGAMAEVGSRVLTVVVVHHWEMFDAAGRPRAVSVAALHALSALLAAEPDVKVVSLDDVADGRVPIG